ncbi:hypothetical protein VP01_679g6 [Puccinia sorghi]|uniref:Uncharacterized protein n=1 Tax=Puccinia sorghi TaxID=27349 RepID=A0A0L6UEN1_9BASI|nr:hypothetical protein VP01_679g6 [Puccinia sorghi]
MISGLPSGLASLSARHTTCCYSQWSGLLLEDCLAPASSWRSSELCHIQSQRLQLHALTSCTNNVDKHRYNGWLIKLKHKGIVQKEHSILCDGNQTCAPLHFNKELEYTWMKCIRIYPLCPFNLPCSSDMTSTHRRTPRWDKSRNITSDSKSALKTTLGHSLTKHQKSQHFSRGYQTHASHVPPYLHLDDLHQDFPFIPLQSPLLIRYVGYLAEISLPPLTTQVHQLLESAWFCIGNSFNIITDAGGWFEMPDLPVGIFKYHIMIYYGKFNSQQLKWLQHNQARVDREIAQIECSSSAPTGGGQHASDPAKQFDPYFSQRLQEVLNQLSATLDIPLAAVPNVKACWDAERCMLVQSADYPLTRAVPRATPRAAPRANRWSTTRQSKGSEMLIRSQFVVSDYIPKYSHPTTYPSWKVPLLSTFSWILVSVPILIIAIQYHDLLCFHSSDTSKSLGYIEKLGKQKDKNKLKRPSAFFFFFFFITGQNKSYSILQKKIEESQCVDNMGIMIKKENRKKNKI